MAEEKTAWPADAPARQSKYAKARDQRQKDVDRIRAQKYGKQFNRILRERAPAILAYVEKQHHETATLLWIVVYLFGATTKQNRIACLDYLQQRHDLSAADVGEMTDADLVEIFVHDVKAAIRPRGRKQKEQTADERRIVESYQCQNRPHKVIARDLSLPRKLVTKTIRTLQTRIRRERLKTSQ